MFTCTCARSVTILGQKSFKPIQTDFTYRQCNPGGVLNNAQIPTHTHSSGMRMQGIVVRDKLTSHYSKQTLVRSNAKTSRLTLSGEDNKTNHSLQLQEKNKARLQAFIFINS